MSLWMPAVAEVCFGFYCTIYPEDGAEAELHWNVLCGFERSLSLLQWWELHYQGLFVEVMLIPPIDGRPRQVSDIKLLEEVPI